MNKNENLKLSIIKDKDILLVSFACCPALYILLKKFNKNLSNKSFK